MSFQVSITGHSSLPHNASVRAAIDAAKAELVKVEGLSGTVTGYTNDGEYVSFSESFAAPAPAVETTDAAAGEQPGTEPTNSEPTTEPSNG
ncbi:MAG: hypothetical protein ACHQC8_02455 [Solirubrobacterales bacterium]